MNKKTIKIIISWLLVLIWMLIIFNFSTKNTEVSNNQSKEVIDKVIDTTIDTSNRIGITDNVPTKEEKQNLIDNLNKPLRKCMHFTIFFILSFLILNALNQTNIKHKYLITIIICIIYALTDEYHQTFVTGRTGQLTDVIIDITGALMSLILTKITLHNKK